MKLRIYDDAAAYLRAERAYLARFDKRAASAMIQQLRQTMEMLRRFPQAGQALEGSRGVRRFSVPPYLVDYEVVDGISASSSYVMRVSMIRIFSPTQAMTSKISDYFQMFEVISGFFLLVCCTGARGRGFGF